MKSNNTNVQKYRERRRDSGHVNLYVDLGTVASRQFVAIEKKTKQKKRQIVETAIGLYHAQLKSAK